MKRKTLSEKEIKRDNEKEDNGFFWSKDVKKAVKRLKEEVRARDVPVSGIMEEIDKIFGEFNDDGNTN